MAWDTLPAMTRLTSLCSLLALLALPGATSTAHADDDDDVGVSREAVCCGANCCSIAGSCLSRGDTNPANPCQECNPSSDQFDWTDMPGCTPPDAGPPAVDAGAPAVDAGSTTPDAGSPGTDAGSTTPPVDAGSSSGTDAGTGGGEDGGCAVSPGRGHAALPVGLGLALAVMLWRRRRLS